MPNLRRSIAWIAIAIVVVATRPGAAQEDNPLLRRLLAQKAREALQSHDAPERGWQARDKRTSQVTKKILDRTVVLASITHEAEVTVWLLDPEQTLNFEIVRLQLPKERMEAEIRISGRVKAVAWIKATNLPRSQITSSGTMHARLGVNSTLRDQRLADVEVTKWDCRFSELQFDQEILNALRPWLRDLANQALERKSGENTDHIRRALESTLLAKPT